jgi:hypothetical protein
LWWFADKNTTTRFSSDQLDIGLLHSKQYRQDKHANPHHHSQPIGHRQYLRAIHITSQGAPIAQAFFWNVRWDTRPSDVFTGLP